MNGGSANKSMLDAAIGLTSLGSPAGSQGGSKPPSPAAANSIANGIQGHPPLSSAGGAMRLPPPAMAAGGAYGLDPASLRAGLGGIGSLSSYPGGGGGGLVHGNHPLSDAAIMAALEQRRFSMEAEQRRLAMAAASSVDRHHPSMQMQAMNMMDQRASAYQQASSYYPLDSSGYAELGHHHPAFQRQGLYHGHVGFQPGMMMHQGHHSHLHQAAAEAAASHQGAGAGGAAAGSRNFPETLFDIVSSEANAHIISWLPHGQGFIIHDKQRFAELILPCFFDGAKFTSFTRRLKRWNFTRVARGPELGAYYNPNFVRDRPELVQKMRYRVERGQGQDGEGDDEAAKEKDADDKKKEKNEDEKEQKEDGEKKAKDEADKEEDASALVRERDMFQQQQSHVLASKISVETRSYFSNPEELQRPMPLPSALPKRPAKKRRIVMGDGGAGPVAAEDSFAPAGGASSVVTAASSVAGAAPPPMPFQGGAGPRNPAFTQQDILEERRMLEIEREMYLGRLAGGGGAGPRFPVPQHGQQVHAGGAAGPVHGLTDAERAEHINRILRAELAPGSAPAPAYLDVAPNVMASSSRMPADADAAALRDYQSRLAPPFRGAAAAPGAALLQDHHLRRHSHQWSAPGGGRQDLLLPKPASAQQLGPSPGGGGPAYGDKVPVMMSPEEREGFTRYLMSEGRMG